MFGPSRPLTYNMHWDYHRPPRNPQWRHPGGPRAPFRGQQRFHQQRPVYQSGYDNFWCETCDRGFPTEDVLNKHKLQHQKCNIDGCQFIAHPKVITKHIQMQHSSGLYKKIANINKPEDIEKWREERRKKYPTRSNMDKKAAELKEKIDRGEKMGLERNRFPHKPNPGYYNDHKSGIDFKRRNNMGSGYQPRSKYKRNSTTNNNIEKKPRPRTASKTLPLIEENKKLKPFTGILNMQVDTDNEIEDTPQFNDLIEDDENENFNIVEIKSQDNIKPVVCGALSSLMCDYGSSDEEDKKKILSNVPIKTVKHSTGNVNETNDLDLSQLSAAHRNKYLEGIIKCEVEIKESINLVLETQENVASTCEVEVKKKVFDPTKDIKKEYVDPVDMAGYYNYTVECENDKKLIISIPTQNGNGDDNDSGPEEMKVVKKEITIIPEHFKPKIVSTKKNALPEKKSILRQPKPKLPSTLLHKLLFKEMQQERNVVLQCIRYITRNHYFDKQQ